MKFMNVDHCIGSGFNQYLLAGRTRRQGEESEPFGRCAKETPDMCPCTAQQNGFLDGESQVGVWKQGGWELCNVQVKRKWWMIVGEWRWRSSKSRHLLIQILSSKFYAKEACNWLLYLYSFTYYIFSCTLFYILHIYFSYLVLSGGV